MADTENDTNHDETPSPPLAFRVEYDEQYVRHGEPLEIYAVQPCRIRILDVTQVADELRYRYCVIWDGGDE